MDDKQQDIVIRFAALADLSQLVDIEAASFEVYRLTRERLRYFLTRAKAEIFVAEQESQILGYLLMLCPSRYTSARVYSIAVDPTKRGLGIGSKLLVASAKRAVEKGYLTLHLEVREKNKQLQQLYFRHGFSVVRRLRDYYPDGDSALKLSRSLLS